ncbi:hypothetical protein KVR01_007894 [Diaporthe batatas]|uniref:uncharacterized protein n=1 Tax=Diaporthe batatas TaxID=748121 RepID=UPI001D043015|nr:uncharacterized protein KVR01_007894 [Diaporthe batatas]KAG8162129.1 hypothetical protein KVR01_007894 [Diaporthe batatas]
MSPAAHPRLIFGGSSIGDHYATPQEVTGLLQRLRVTGIRELDTAARYPAIKFGASEQLLGEVGAAAQGFAVDTKILVLSTDGNGSLEPAKIQDSVSKSRVALQMGVEKLNVLYCHVPDFETPLEVQAAALDALHKKGTFDKLGVCSWPEEMLDQFIAICDRKGYVKPTVYQGLYNLVCRGHESIFPALRKHGIVYNAYSPLGGGFLSGKLTSGSIEGTRFGRDNIVAYYSRLQYDKQELHDAVNALDDILQSANISKIEAALRWISYHSSLGAEDGIILGASKLQYLDENIAAIEKGPLPAEIASRMSGLWGPLSGQWEKKNGRI